MKSKEMHCEAPIFQARGDWQRPLLACLRPVLAASSRGEPLQPCRKEQTAPLPTPSAPHAGQTELVAGTGQHVCLTLGLLAGPGCMPARHPGRPGLGWEAQPWGHATPALGTRLRVPVCACVREGGVPLLVCSSPGGFLDPSPRMAPIHTHPHTRQLPTRISSLVPSSPGTAFPLGAKPSQTHTRSFTGPPGRPVGEPRAHLTDVDASAQLRWRLRAGGNTELKASGMAGGMLDRAAAEGRLLGIRAFPRQVPVELL